MRIGCIGLGSIGRRHVGNLLALGCEVVAMDVSREARDAAAQQYPHARIVDALPFVGLDALVIAPPAQHHLIWVEEAIRRALPFFVEKPLGVLEQLPRWRELAALPLPVNQVGYNLRFHSDAIALKHQHPAPAIGHFHCDCDMGQWPGRSYGSALLEMSHEIDLALWLGAPREPIDGWAEGSEADIWFGNFRWRVSLNGSAGAYHRWWYVDGDERTFDSPSALGDGMYVDELVHFLGSIYGGAPLACPLSEGLAVLEVCQQVEQMTKVPA